MTFWHITFSINGLPNEVYFHRITYLICYTRKNNHDETAHKIYCIVFWIRDIYHIL